MYGQWKPVIPSLLPLSPISSVPWLPPRHLLNPCTETSLQTLGRVLPSRSHFSLSWSQAFLLGPAILWSPEVSHSHITCLGGCQVSPPLESCALDFVLWGLAVWGRRRFHPSTRDRSNTNAEFIEVVKQSVDNMDGVFLINTAIPRETANCREVSKTQQRFPRLTESGFDITGLTDVAQGTCKAVGSNV